MKRIFNESSIETNMIWGLLLILFGFILAIVLSFKMPGTFLSLIGVLLLLLGALIYGRAFYKVWRWLVSLMNDELWIMMSIQSSIYLNMRWIFSLRKIITHEITFSKWKKLNKMSHNTKYFFCLRIFWKPHIALAQPVPNPDSG